jgi:hypothetical protein
MYRVVRLAGSAMVNLTRAMDAVRHVRRLQPLSGAHFVEQLTEKTERVNLIVAPAGRKTAHAAKTKTRQASFSDQCPAAVAAILLRSKAPELSTNIIQK